jgi:hypothetical protein
VQSEDFGHEIELTFAHGRQMKTGSIQEYLRTRFYLSMNKVALASLFERDTHLKSCLGIPMETAQLEVMPKQTEDFVREAVSVIEGIPAHLAFNMDELGHQESADRKFEICLVLAFHFNNHVTVLRTAKRG